MTTVTRPSCTTLQILLSSSAQSEMADDVAHLAYTRVVDACREGGAWLQTEGGVAFSHRTACLESTHAIYT